MIIRPYTDPELLAKCASPTAADFPCLKHLFHWGDVANGATSWTDRIGGVIMTTAGSCVKDASGVYVSGQQTKGGSAWCAPGTSEFVLFMAGTITAANTTIFRVGGITAIYPGVDSRASTNSQIVFDGSNYLSTAAFAGPPTFPITGVHMFHADTSSDNEARKYIADSAGTINLTAAKDATTGTIAQTWGAFADDNTSPGDALGIALPSVTTDRMKMLGVLVFESPPPDLQAATLWMAANLGYLYPGFYGRS